LIAISGLQDREILIDRNEFIIGRTLESGCDYVIPEPFISPRHCMLLFQDGNLTIKDLGSKNGTFVNGERLPREREVIVPFGSEIGVTRSVIFELYDPAADIVLEEIIRSSEHGDTAHGAGGDEGDLVFRPLPGINYADDEGAEIDDDYSPL
jgi:pSer/pThr/pTyr-binding forkhead associated (FHA) protein